MVHIYYGDGKGKTTAAVGLCIRSAGRGQSVIFAQFMKSADSGERKILETIPNVSLTPCPDEIPFTFQMTDEQRAFASRFMRTTFDNAAAMALTEKCSLIVLDEIFTAINERMIPENDVFSFVSDSPSALEIVLTGHNPPKKFLEIADYISEIKNIKHPYSLGFPPRLGIEL